MAMMWTEDEDPILPDYPCRTRTDGVEVWWDADQERWTWSYRCGLKSYRYFGTAREAIYDVDTRGDLSGPTVERKGLELCKAITTFREMRDGKLAVVATPQCVHLPGHDGHHMARGPDGRMFAFQDERPRPERAA